MALVLIVEDENLLRWALARQLQRAGHEAHVAPDLATATEHITAHRPDVVLLDLGLPDGHGLDFFEANRERMAESKVIVMTALSQVEEAVRAMKLGALEFLTKPVDEAELVALVNRSLAVRNEQLEAQAMRRAREQRLSQQVVGDSAAFLGVREVIEQVAASEVGSILIQGESGSGKNVLARRIHSLSARHEKPILEVSCATIPENLLESELFGYEKGAFTDAKSMKRGVFELAEGGTVVLDEIGELRLDVQAKLLHFLEERRFRRVGGTRELQVDIRVIGLTNRELHTMVRDKTFRADLFYRLNVFPVAVPPLRERPEDILPLARHFLATVRPKLGARFTGFDADAERLLARYPWPGNVRELRNVVERALVVERGTVISARSLMLDGAGEPGTAPSAAGLLPPGIVPLETLEREMILRAVTATGGNTTRAAEQLGVTRDQLRYRLKKFGIKAGDGE